MSVTSLNEPIMPSSVPDSGVVEFKTEPGRTYVLTLDETTQRRSAAMTRRPKTLVLFTLLLAMDLRICRAGIGPGQARSG